MKLIRAIAIAAGLLALTARAGTIVGTVAAHGPAPAGGADTSGGYASLRYKFAEKIDYDHLQDFVVYLNQKVPGAPAAMATQEMAQHFVAFEPHVLVVAVGTRVDWPNKDDIYHNVFSMSDNDEFNLGLRTKQDQTQTYLFAKEGRIDVFCSIHSKMHGIIWVLPSPYFVKVNARQRYRIEGVPAGTYPLRAWQERMPHQEKTVTVPADGEVRVDFDLGLDGLPKAMSAVPATLPPRVGFQTKVLIPVLVSLVLLPIIVGAIVASFLNRQQRESGQQDLTTAQKVFELSLHNRSHELSVRFRGVANSSAFIPVAQQLALPAESANHVAAARNSLRTAMDEQLKLFGDECQVIVFTPGGAASPADAIALKQKGEQDRSLTGPAPAFSETQFAANAATITAEALAAGETRDGIVTVGGAVFYAVAVPVDDPPTGTMTFGRRLDESTMQNLKNITNAEIVLTGDQGVLPVSTLPNSAVPAEESGEVVLGGEHYLARSGAYDAVGPHRGFRYVLLLSLEGDLAMQSSMNRLVAEVSLSGILLSAAAVWYFTSRSMRPLRDLRDSAEAVGRGDFSRRIGRYSNDETGDLAQAFNRMTENLRSSRSELQQTVDTLQATQAQLIQSEKLSAVGQFVSGVAHELNNPLAAVIGFSELLALTNQDATIRPHLDMIVKSSQRCHKIVQNLLSFARQHPPERTQVQINAAIDEVLEFMAYEFRTGNVSIIRQYEENLPTILADPHQLQQIFVNILGNARQAIQAFRQDGAITVRTRRVDQMVRIELSDNGPGIRPENLSRIFDPFFTTKAVGKGTGLGLSLCYGMIREHGGNIRAESVVGCGATFVLDFPAAAGSGSRSAPSRLPPRTGGPAAPSGKIVLVVDDEEWLLSLAAQLLEQDGHAAVLARNGEDAITALNERRFDLIISDWKMPGLSGVPFYEHLQAVHPAAAQRIMFMSGDVMNDGLRDFVAKHGKVCLQKPFPIAEFSSVVSAQLGLR